jgi:hypothetical protein
MMVEELGPMGQPYREKLYRLLCDGEERHCDVVDEELRDIAWELKEYRRIRIKCRYCGEFYLPKVDEDVWEICTFCCTMEEFEAADDED